MNNINNLRLDDAQKTMDHLNEIKQMTKETSQHIERFIEKLNANTQKTIEHAIKTIESKYDNFSKQAIEKLRHDAEEEIDLQISLIVQKTLEKLVSKQHVRKEKSYPYSYFEDAPVFIGSNSNRIFYIPSDFILWEKCTIMLWVLVSPYGDGIRKDSYSSYLLAHHTGKTGDKKYYNQFSLRYSPDYQLWVLMISNQNATYYSHISIPDDPSLSPAWHHFMISWDRSEDKILFCIDGGKQIEVVQQAFPFNYWPMESFSRVSVGSWLSPFIENFCDTELYNMTISNDFLTPDDELVKNHFDNMPI